MSLCYTVVHLHTSTQDISPLYLHYSVNLRNAHLLAHANCCRSTATFTEHSDTRWLSAVRACQPSAIKIFPSPLHVFGTVCCSMSHLHHHCLSSAAVWRHISLGAAFLDCSRHSYCCALEVMQSLRTHYHSCYYCYYTQIGNIHSRPVKNDDHRFGHGQLMMDGWTKFLHETNLTLAQGQWCHMVGKVTAGLVKSNGGLPPGYVQRQLRANCLETGISSGAYARLWDWDTLLTENNDDD